VGGGRRTWESFYPLDDLDQQQRALFANLEQSMADFVELLINHRPQMLRGKSLVEVMASTNVNTPGCWLSIKPGVKLRKRCGWRHLPWSLPYSARPGPAKD
jgi:hypothetical protein